MVESIRSILTAKIQAIVKTVNGMDTAMNDCLESIKGWKIDWYTAPHNQSQLHNGYHH